ncbi:hypothetical protein G7Y89_g14192 [Cudoniella acicularis]|uniref:Uncharacterized protein n=1 Tax=Cudoniella acicularis TaxID=354080 RepID=A0A8H4VXI2_9HELO|nr:hypothetical protein G7Y89_g14192 [Cudoniella acicularis]
MKDISKIAILSWRWDDKDGLFGSRNACGVLQHAKKIGIEYLFVDTISIDQSHPDAEKSKKIKEFTELYHRIPFMAAYYDPRQNHIVKIMRRPWILCEVRHFKHNPTLITYINVDPLCKVDRQGDTGFHMMCKWIWSSGFTPTILALLGGVFTIEKIADLRYIMSHYERVLAAAFAQMPRNDYLLTAAILSQVGQDRRQKCLAGYRDGEVCAFVLPVEGALSRGPENAEYRDPLGYFARGRNRGYLV